MRYQRLPKAASSDGTHGHALRRRLEQGETLELADVKNGMDESVFARYPDVARTRSALLAAGAVRAVLCGTGSTFFSPFERLEDALGVRRRLESRSGGSLTLTTILTQIQGLAP